VVAGAPRCGTTALFRWAAAHPQIGTPRIKETRYLNDPGHPLFNPRSNYPKHGLEGYNRIIPYRIGARAYLEATPDYMYQETALSVLAELPTKPKIIFLLREPAERMLSLFKYAMNNVGSLDARLSIQECLLAARDGRPLGDQILNSAFQHSVYHTWLEKWISRLGRSRVHVYFFDELANEPLKMMRDFCRRIGVDEEFYDTFHFRPENQSYVVRSPVLARAKFALRKLRPAARPARSIIRAYHAINARRDARAPAVDKALNDQLRDRFAEHNRRLAQLLQRELPSSWNAG